METIDLILQANLPHSASSVRANLEGAFFQLKIRIQCFVNHQGAVMKSLLEWPLNLVLTFMYDRVLFDNRSMIISQEYYARVLSYLTGVL